MSQIKNCHQILKRKKIRILDWPGNSPDLNPIKNLLVVLENKAFQQQPSSLKLFENVIKTVWTRGITSDYCCKLIESVPRRLKMLVKNKAENTKY